MATLISREPQVDRNAQLRLSARPADQVLLDLVAEAGQLRSAFETQWDRNLELYNGVHWTTTAPDGLVQKVLNLTKKDIDALAAVMSEQRPDFDFIAREFDPKASIYYMNPESGASVRAQIETAKEEKAQQLQQMVAEAQEQGVPQEQIEQAAQQAQQVIAQIGNLPLAEEHFDGDAPITYDMMKAMAPVFQQIGIPVAEAFSQVDDNVVSEALQLVFRAMWEIQDWDSLIRRLIQKTLIFGHTPMLIEWDDEMQIVDWTGIPVKNVWIDPNASTTRDAEYAIVAQVMSVEKAAESFPDAAQEIIRGGRRGAIGRATQFGGHPISSVFNLNYSRDMAVVMTGWYKHQPFNDIEEDEEGNRTSTNLRFGTRQMMTANDSEIEDGVSPFGDMIPIAWFKNIDTPDKPYTQGEPEVLCDIQDGINRQWSVLLNHQRYFQSPIVIVSRSFAQIMGDRAQGLWAHPNRIFVVDDDFAQLGGKPIEIIFPPQVNQAQTNLLGNMIDLFHDLSGQVSVLRGESPGADTAARSILALSRNARGTIGYRTSGIEEGLRYAIEVSMKLIIDNMSDEAWSRYTDKYRPVVLKAIRDLAKSFKYDVRVKLSSGKGVSRNDAADKALLLRGQGDMDRRTLLETLELEPEGITARIQAEQLEAAQLQLQVAQAQAELQTQSAVAQQRSQSELSVLEQQATAGGESPKDS